VEDSSRTIKNAGAREGGHRHGSISGSASW
jgi:hypothetical protein